MLFARQQAPYCHFGTPATPSAPYPPPVTNSHRIRSSAKHTRNPFRIRTFKTQDLNFFRMNIYKKTGEGIPSAPSSTQFNLCSSSFFLRETSVYSAPLRYPLVSSLAAPCMPHTHEHPQPFSAHGLTARFSGYPGGGGATKKELSFREKRGICCCLFRADHGAQTTGPFPLIQSTSPNTPSPLAHLPSAAVQKSPAQSSPLPDTSSLSIAQ